MKKLILVLIFAAVISPVFAQTISEHNKSKMYYLNVPVEKIYLSLPGYIVQYRKNDSNIKTIGIPYNWFTDAAGKAEMLLLPPGKNWPTLSVFFLDGEFSHLRLYVHKSKGHQTWGIVPQGADVSKNFQDADNIKFEF